MLSVVNALDYLIANWRVGAILGAACLAVSLCLIARLWLLQPSDGVVGRLAWSFVLLVPILGWLFFAAFYHAPPRLAGDGHAEHGQGAGEAATGSAAGH